MIQTTEILKKYIGAFFAKTKDIIIHFPRYTVQAFHITVIFSSFFTILLFFLISLVVSVVRKIPFVSKIFVWIDPVWNRSVQPWYQKIYDKLESLRPFKVRRKYLIYVAYQNLLIRKSRSLITILGMSIGVGIIVYLLSLGYGIEKLVISQVATLDELKIIDVSPGESSSTSLDKKTLAKIKQMESVQSVIPMISVVGKLTYKKAQTDILVYAVTNDFFKHNNANLVNGEHFALKENNLNFTEEVANGQVAGASAETPRATLDSPVTGEKVQFAVLPNTITSVWKDCSIESQLLGVTVRKEGDYEGVEYWGREYAPFEPYGHAAYDEERRIYLGSWVKSEVLLYSQTESDKKVSPVLDENGVQKWVSGCINRRDIQINQRIPLFASVLGESTSSASLSASISTSSDSAALEETEDATDSANLAGNVVSTDSAGLEVVQLEQSKTAPKKAQQLLSFKNRIKGEAVASTGLLKLLNISPGQAINQQMELSFIIIKSLMPTLSGRILTEKVTYKVVGVVEDNESQFIYIPFVDMQTLGISRYSQAKVVLGESDSMPKVRKQIETLGYKTTSTNDTKQEIETFFNGLRGVLGVLGFIALGVASLGMFNTLTVSLLERTREIGGMKTMGMVSGEIQELFLAEAMIMGLGGGAGGLLLGFMVGKMTSYVISLIAIAQGVGYLELTYIPSPLVLFIIVSSFIVGVLTGLYPSYRAKKISALNALRYE